MHLRLDRAIGVLVGISAALVVLGPLARFADYLRQRDRAEPEDPAWWARAVDLSTEANLPTWWSAVLLVGLAALFALAGALHHAGGGAPRGRPYWLLAGVALVLSIDEAIALHEEVLGEVGDQLVDGGGLLHFTWVVPGLVLAVVVGIAVLRASAALPAPVRRGLVLGGAVFLAGALGVEAISGAVFDARGHDRLYLLATTVEEGLELAGVLIAIAAARGLLDVRISDPAGWPAGGPSGDPAAAPAIVIHPAAPPPRRG